MVVRRGLVSLLSHLILHLRPYRECKNFDTKYGNGTDADGNGTLLPTLRLSPIYVYTSELNRHDGIAHHHVIGLDHGGLIYAAAWGFM